MSFRKLYMGHGARRAILALAGWLCLAAAIMAQVPLKVHYQGRLTNAQNQPITVATTVFFSIWSGGTAGVANQTTELYRESTTITPDANGIFNDDIGTGTVLAGALTAAMFNTAQPVFVQVAVNTVGNVMLPRALVTTVGYSFVAENAIGDITPKSVSIQGVGTVINSSGNWVGGGHHVARRYDGWKRGGRRHPATQRGRIHERRRDHRR